MFVARHRAEWRACCGRVERSDEIVEANIRGVVTGVAAIGDGWAVLKSRHPPFETWNLPFYGTRLPQAGCR